MSSKKGEYISAVRKGLVASIHDDQGKLDQLLGRSLNNLQTFVTEKINKPAGLKYLNLMLPCLIERFKGMMEEITEERKELNQLDIYENTYSTKRSKIEEAANISRFNIFKNRRKLIERACDEFVDVVNEEATCVHEIERRTAAIFFYRKMIDKAEYIKDTVLSYENNLKKIIEKISLLRERLKEKDNTNHYTLNITGDYLEALSLEDKDKSVDNLFSNSNIELAGIVIKSWYGEEGYNALFKLITDAFNKHTEKFSELTILDALAKISPERQKALFTDFIKKLGVQSSVHPNFVKYDYIIHEWYCAMGAFVKQTSNREGKSITDGDFLLIDLEKDMDFYNSKKEEELRKNALSNISMAFNKTYGFAPWFSEIGSPDKITLSFYKTAVPAFVVNHFLQYQNDLNPESFSNKHWAEAITQSNYTIFPKDAE
jgi:hypothetical protein